MEIQNIKKRPNDELLLDSPEVRINDERPSPSFTQNIQKAALDQIDEQTFAEDKSEVKASDKYQNEEEEENKHIEEIAKREGEILEILDNSKEVYKKIFQNLADSEGRVQQNNFQRLVEEVCELVGQTIGSANILSLSSTLRNSLERLHKIKVEEQKQEKQKQSQSGDILEKDYDQSVGIIFNEFYHELFMVVIKNGQEEKILESLIKEDLDASINISPSNQTLTQIKNDLRLPSNAQLDKFPSNSQVDLRKSEDIPINEKSRVNKIKATVSTPVLDKQKLQRLLTIIDSLAESITQIFNNRKFSLKIQINEVFEILPVKVIKKIQEDDITNQSMNKSIKATNDKHKSQDFRTLETFETEVSNLMRHLVDNDGKKANIDLFKESIEAVFVGKSGLVKLELIEKGADDEMHKKDAQSLDEFLLMNQSSLQSLSTSPNIPEQIRGTINTYQSMIDNKKYKNETEKKRLLDLIRSLQGQLDKFVYPRDDRKSNNSVLEPFDILPQKTQELTPVIEKSPEQVQYLQLNKIEKREKMLKNIFDFYCKQQMLLGKKATFEEIQRDLSVMNMAEFMRFCLDFRIPLMKSKIVEVFKKNAGNLKELEYSKFNDTLVKLFNEQTKEQIRHLQKKIVELNLKQNTSQFNTQSKEIQNQLTKLKQKSPDDLLEEAYLFLELDHPHRVEQKKKGLILPFHTHAKDQGASPPYASSSSKHRMIVLSQDEKQALKDRVQRLKMQRELSKKNMKDVKNLRYTQMRQLLLQNVGETSEKGSQKPTSAVSANLRKGVQSLGPQQRRVNRKDSHQVLTLAQLAQISYLELNSNSVDDFNPQTFGFEINPTPIILDTRPSEVSPLPQIREIKNSDYQQSYPSPFSNQISQPYGNIYQPPVSLNTNQGQSPLQITYQTSPNENQRYNFSREKMYQGYHNFQPISQQPLYQGPVMNGRQQPIQQNLGGSRATSQNRGVMNTKQLPALESMDMSQKQLIPEQMYQVQSQSQYIDNQQSNPALLQKQLQMRSTSGNNRNQVKQQSNTQNVYGSTNPYKQIKIEKQSNMMNYYQKSRGPPPGHMLPPLPIQQKQGQGTGLN